MLWMPGGGGGWGVGVGGCDGSAAVLHNRLELHQQPS